MASQQSQDGARESVALLDLPAVAAFLNCSQRHVTRQVSAGRLPAPVRIGVLRRWPRAALERWIDEGCPATARGEVPRAAE